MSTTSRRAVLEAIRDLHNQEQTVTRELLANVMGVARSIIDGHIRILIEDGCITRVRSGIYAPMIKHRPAREISKTMLSAGMVRIVIGDSLETDNQRIDAELILTPQEARYIGSLMMGDALQFSNIETGFFCGCYKLIDMT